MEFPAQALLLLLKFVRKESQLTPEVLAAGIDILKYVWSKFMDSTWVAQGKSDQDIEECLVQALDEGHSEAKTFVPAIWVTIGLYVLEKILERIVK